MRVVIQRVNEAYVAIENKRKSAIGLGLVVLLGIEHNDTHEDADWLCAKLARLRIFADENGLMNHDIQTVGGSFIVVSQFTLHASTKKGNRPSYIRAARPEQAVPLYEYFVEKLEEISGCGVFTGEFGAYMQVGLVNDGPVTIIMDSAKKE
ncbi:MAG: D-aminoacyl-tRNA deacylase [Bacteroidales bacterium]|jgi:D-tyrosyl-tRNA(Tyr) deacylase|nr:D-aminoacyl-tRNA deacylase [Bacteroidales bacterium]MDD4086501.1 D-aminoacyl-tRNA deacylase [Bacteroidales bacterium]MDY0085223.1 D-aminoacyl-tRNA deacylase [Bacteroidales bacterium]